MKILDFLFAFSDMKKIIFVDCEEDFQLLKEMLVSLDDFHKDIDDLSDDYLKSIIEAWIDHRANSSSSQ